MAMTFRIAITGTALLVLLNLEAYNKPSSSACIFLFKRLKVSVTVLT